jgi:hypothetical protein
VNGPPVSLALAVPVTASTTTYGAPVRLPIYDKLVLVAQLAAGSVSTLDVTVQESWDFGTTWTDVAHFTQLTAAATKNYRLVLPAAGTVTTVGVGTASSAAPVLAAGDFADGPWGPMLRLVSVTGSGTNAAIANQNVLLVPWRQTMGAAA